MKITRHNYEEFFILYLDNELSSDDRREVELFVKENSDLQAELTMLFQSQLSADTDVVFTGKEMLLKTAGKSITQDNYEQWLLSYIDNELTPTEITSLEQFLAERPSIRAELDILQKTKLQSEHIVFPDKSSLYRREEKVKIIAFNWRRIAIAASVLLTIGTAAVVVLTSKDDHPTDIAKSESKKAIPPVQQITKPAIKEDVKETEAAKDQLALADEPVKTANENATRISKETQQKQSVPVIETPGIADPNKENIVVVPPVKKSNELAAPVYNPNVNKVSPQHNPIAMNETPVQEPLTISKETSPVATVTPATSGTLYTSNTLTASIDPVDENQTGKKNKLRGFFRKVTRTFEKNTNIKATDDEDRLLLGGLAIRL